MGASYNGKTMSFTYNDEGIRTSKTVNGVTTTYYLSGSQIIGEETSGNITVYLYDASGSVIGMQYHEAGSASTAWDSYWFEKNLQGDIVAIYNASGTKLVSYIYDAWGNFTPSEDSTSIPAVVTNNPFTYRGYYYDYDLGLYYLQSRYYDSVTSRFISADEVNFLGANGDLNSYNLYAYCSNNPIIKKDPTGHFPWLILAAVLFTPVGGTALQVATSAVSYAGMAVASIFDEDIRNDMNAIGWNPFNTDESATLNSSKVSFYKGAPVFRTSNERSGSFGAIFLTKGSIDDDLRHERGHNSQLMMMGIGTYGFTVGIPSPAKLGKWDKAGNYYGAPWETMADILGGVKGRPHSSAEIWNAWGYYAVSTLCFPFTSLYWL